MFGSEILDVVIGLVFVYVLFSLICTTLTEGISRIFAMRAGTLESAIRNMIEGSRMSESVAQSPTLRGNQIDPKAPATLNSVALDVKALYTSARLHSLARPGRLDRLRSLLSAEDKKWRASRPSYIPSRSFTLALFDTLLEAGASDKTEPDVPDDALQAQIGEAKSAIEQVLPEGLPLREQIIMLLDDDGTPSHALQGKAQATFRNLRDAVDAIQPDESYLKKGLMSVLDQAEQEAQDFDGALAKARIGVEEWFDDSMDRVSGWYARNTRSIVVGFAIVVTVVFNVDTLAIATALQAEPVLREAVVSQAEAFIVASEVADEAAGESDTGEAEEPPPTISELQAEIDKLGVPIGWVVITDGPKNTSEITDPARQSVEWINSTIAFVTNLPVATWDQQDPLHIEEIEKAKRYRQEWPDSAQDVGKKLAGLFITIVALSLGAPFWFDALNKLVNLRAAGSAPARADAVDASISVNAQGKPM